jgi:hypothetical protein
LRVADIWACETAGIGMGNSRSRRACVEALATRIAGPMSSGSRAMGAPPALDKSGFDMPSHDGSAVGVLIVPHTSCFRLTQIVAVTFDT